MEHFQQLKPLLNEMEKRLMGTSIDERVNLLNLLSNILQAQSPFAHEPLSNIRWVNVNLIEQNTYNPNNMAPPELRLLTRSLLSEGFTQPLVVRQISESRYVIIDGYHRHNIILNNKVLYERLNGFVPVVLLREPRDDAKNMAATIRHNRARGSHQVQVMSSLITKLNRLGWSQEHIARELGMDFDEVLRLRQLDGLGELFHNRSYSRAWTIEE